MPAMNPTVDPANVIQALVYTLLDVFDATRDLYQTLRAKEKRDYEQSLRSRGYPSSRSVEYVDDQDLDSEEALIMDKAAVTRQFDIGLQEIGGQFAIGDVLSQTALQSQIITLQSVIITTFLYGPTSSDPISRHLSSIVEASRAAGTASVDILAAQRHRQLTSLPPTPISVHSPVPRGGPTQAPPYPATTATGISSASTALIKSRHEPPPPRRASPVNTTVLEWQGKPKYDRTDTDTTSLTGPTSYGTQSAPHSLYCLYALDLQRHPAQTLSETITCDSSPFCPYCRRVLHLSPGKSWEIFKDDEGIERCFRVQNRFVVKCHRNTVDGGYSCVLCSRSAAVDTVCGDVKALIRHVWMDHGIGELELEEDVTEVTDEFPDQRRDSGLGFRERRRSMSSRRSVSLGPSRSKRRPPRFEREVETLQMRPRHQN